MNWTCVTCSDEANYSHNGKKYCVGHWNYGEPWLLPSNTQKEKEDDRAREDLSKEV